MFFIKNQIVRVFTGGVAFALLFFFNTKGIASDISHKKRPFFSVVIPTYNRRVILPRAIESILAQTETDYELVILNDGSNDGTHQLLTQYQKEYPQIRVITLPKNKGVAHARNVLNQEARGRYIAIMDSDDVAHPLWLEKMHSFILQNKDAEIFIPKKAEFINDDLHIQKPLSRPLKHIFYGNSFENVGNVFKHSFVLEHHIQYNETYLCGEDYDFWFQMLLKGAKVRSFEQSEPLVMVRRHTENGAIYQERCAKAKVAVKLNIQRALIKSETNLSENNLFDKERICLLHNRFIAKFPEAFDEKTKQKPFFPCQKYDLNQVWFKR